MANVSTGPRPEASQSETAGPDSTSRVPPTTASATQPMRGSGPASATTAAASSSAEPRKWPEANSTASEGGRSPSDARASAAARRPASPGSAASTRAPPAFTGPGYVAFRTHLPGRRDQREPDRVTVAGEPAGVLGYAGDDVEDDGAGVGVLTHAGRGLGDGPDQLPRPPPDVAAAVIGAVFGHDVQHAIVAAAAVKQPQPRHIGATQVGDQMGFGFLGDPAGAPGQRRQFVDGHREDAGIGHTHEPVVGVPPFTGVHCSCHLSAPAGWFTAISEAAGGPPVARRPVSGQGS